MDKQYLRELLCEHLKQAEEDLARGEETLARQRQVIAELAREGHNVTAATALLAQLEHLQALRISARDRLRRDLFGEQQQIRKSLDR